MDEEEMLKNFDVEAKKIVESETLSKKSSDRYLLVYDNYKKWREENKNKGLAARPDQQEPRLRLGFAKVGRAASPFQNFCCVSKSDTSRNVERALMQAVKKKQKVIISISIYS